MTLLSEMYREGMRPAGFAVAATIRACGSAGEWRTGLEVLRQSQEGKLSKPDPCSLSAAIEVCCSAGELVSCVPLSACLIFWVRTRGGAQVGHSAEKKDRSGEADPPRLVAATDVCELLCFVAYPPVLLLGLRITRELFYRTWKLCPGTQEPMLGSSTRWKF